MTNNNKIKRSLVMCGFLLSVFTLLMLPGCGSSPKSHDFVRLCHRLRFTRGRCNRNTIRRDIQNNDDGRKRLLCF